MAQITLTDTERSDKLTRLGYTPREAEFMSTAALNGGYFVRRQYAEFLNRPDGGIVNQLIERAVALEHVTVATFAGNVRLYHLAARPFYAALGQEDNRNRRQRQPATIKTKLMGLDFIFKHAGRTYLSTEKEKLDFFTGTLGLNRALLPTKRFTSNGRVTERYFVEKFPLFTAAALQDTMPSVVSFCFVDPGLAGVDAFSTFLQHYHCLLGALREFQVIYVADTARRFESAAGAFARMFGQISPLSSATSNNPSVNRLVDHFAARQRYENQEWSSFDRAKLIQFRNERQAFSGDRYDALYRQWGLNGTMAVAAVLSPDRATLRPGTGTFSTYELGRNYDLFGNLTTF